MNSFAVNRVSPNEFIAKDSTSTVWAASVEDRPKDVFSGPPSLLGPKDDFITWPSEETGE